MRPSLHRPQQGVGYPGPDDEAATRRPISGTLTPRRDASRHRDPPLKKLACLLLLLALAGCIPIGARVSNMYTQAPAAQPHS
jgi:hypothetical protein